MSGAVCCLKVEWKFGVDLSSKVEFLLGEKKRVPDRTQEGGVEENYMGELIAAWHFVENMMHFSGFFE